MGPIKHAQIATHGGATISYRYVGTGPGLVLLHGGLENWQSHIDLAELLAGSYTVYLPDRRGRGLSSPHGPDFSMQTEVDDLTVLARSTSTRLAAGISAGALIILQTCMTVPGLFAKAALYEPPLLLDVERYAELAPRHESEIGRGDVPSALITGARITEMGPDAMRRLPAWMVRPLVSLVVKLDDGAKRREMAAQQGVGGEGGPGAGRDGNSVDEPAASMRNLAPTLQYDMGLAREMANSVERFSALSTTKILVMSGTASRPYLIQAADALAGVVPEAKYVKLPGQDHLALGNKTFGGRPDLAAAPLMEFFRDEA